MFQLAEVFDIEGSPCVHSYLHDLEGLDFAGALNMRTPTEIDECTTTVHRTLFSSHQLVNIVQLILAVREHLSKILFCDLQSIEALLFLEDSGRFAIE